MKASRETKRLVLMLHVNRSAILTEKVFHLTATFNIIQDPDGSQNHPRQQTLESTFQLKSCPFSQTTRLAAVELIPCQEIVFYANTTSSRLQSLSEFVLSLKSFQTCH